MDSARLFTPFRVGAQQLSTRVAGLHAWKISPRVDAPLRTNFTSSSAARYTSATSSAKSKTPNFYRSSRVLDGYSQQSTKLVTLRQLCVFGKNMTKEKLVRSANYVRTELPIRLSHRLRDFQALPFIVGMNPHLELVYRMYWEAFDIFRSIPPIHDMEENARFCETIRELLDTHATVIPQLAQGIAESAQHMSPREVDRFMNEMLRSRISRRVLAEQHIRMTEQFVARTNNNDDDKDNARHDWVGIVNTRTHVAHEVQKCVGIVKEMFASKISVVPRVVVDGDIEATFTYIPDHFEYIIKEILKNSFEHTIKTHGELASQQCIRVTIASSGSDITVRVSDVGGGLVANPLTPGTSTASENNIFSFSRLRKKAFSSVPSLTLSSTDPTLTTLDPTTHLGIGLPMSRLYATFWGGNVALVNLEGWGCDVYIRLGRLGVGEERLEWSH